MLKCSLSKKISFKLKEKIYLKEKIINEYLILLYLRNLSNYLQEYNKFLFFRDLLYSLGTYYILDQDECQGGL